jgi:hypothetical protein
MFSPGLISRIVNGFINFLKFSHHQDDISIRTMLLQLSRLLSLWKQDNDTASHTSEDKNIFYRVSCKLDGLMLIMLARANGEVRKTAIQILADFYAITEGGVDENQGEDMSLYAILMKTEVDLPRYATYAFLENYYVGSCLSPQISAGLNLLSVADVASSDFSGLFKYYLGEICSQFTSLGRGKALRHCVKFLRILVVPYLSKRMSRSVHVLMYGSCLVLLTSMAGVPEVSDRPHMLQAVGDTGKLLLDHYLPSIAQV